MSATTSSSSSEDSSQDSSSENTHNVEAEKMRNQVIQLKLKRRQMEAVLAKTPKKVKKKKKKKHKRKQKKSRKLCSRSPDSSSKANEVADLRRELSERKEEQERQLQEIKAMLEDRRFRAAAEKAEAEQAAAEKALAEKATADKLAQEKAAAEKAEAEQAVAEKASPERAAVDNVAQEEAAADKAESNDDWWNSPKRYYSWSGGRNQGKRQRDSRRKAEMAAHSSSNLPVQDKGNTTLVPTPPPPPMNTMIPKDSGSVVASLHLLPTPPPAPMKRTRTDDSDYAPASAVTASVQSLSPTRAKAWIDPYLLDNDTLDLLATVPTPPPAPMKSSRSDDSDCAVGFAVPAPVQPPSSPRTTAWIDPYQLDKDTLDFLAMPPPTVPLKGKALHETGSERPTLLESDAMCV